MKKTVIFLSVLFLVLVGSGFVKSLQFDFVNHGGMSFCESKEEAIERGVYICDIELVSVHSADGPIYLKAKEAWIERLWRQGTWYWTTTPLDDGYRIVINTSLTQDQERTLHGFRITETDRSALGCVKGSCVSTIRSLPPDTIKYKLQRIENLDFSDGNILGELVLAIKKN